MPQYVQVPPQRLDGGVLQALMEEYVTRDGTDYGENELALQAKVSNLRGQLERGDVCLVYELDSEQWDLLPREDAARLQDS
ncbi:MAG: YheU family protein [Halioglobus sp.]|nr:YheU family protein [Halioglobus sp.]